MPKDQDLTLDAQNKAGARLRRKHIAAEHLVDRFLNSSQPSIFERGEKQLKDYLGSGFAFEAWPHPRLQPSSPKAGLHRSSEGTVAIIADKRLRVGERSGALHSESKVAKKYWGSNPMNQFVPSPALRNSFGRLL